MTVTREQAITIAKISAKLNPPSYYSGDDFEPHPWVVDAILAGIHAELMWIYEPKGKYSVVPDVRVGNDAGEFSLIEFDQPSSSSYELTADEARVLGARLLSAASEVMARSDQEVEEK